MKKKHGSTLHGKSRVISGILQRFWFVFTPKHGAWLNFVEGFIGKLTRQSLRGVCAKSKEELVERIYKYFGEVNSEAVVYR